MATTSSTLAVGNSRVTLSLPAPPTPNLAPSYDKSTLPTPPPTYAAGSTLYPTVTLHGDPSYTSLSLRLVSSLLVLTSSPVTLVNNATDTIPAPADFGLTNTTTRANAASYLAALSANCGAVPSNASPSNAAAVPVWSAQAAARSKAAGQTLRATATPARRHKRSKRGHN